MKYVVPLLVACFTFALQTDANGKIISAKINQSSGDPKADGDALVHATVEVDSLGNKPRNKKILTPVTS